MDREPDTTAAALVPGVHRVIRVLDADEGPFRGSLVANGSGVAVLVDSSVYAGWGGWSLAGCEHVAGPLDMVRRADGHDVLLPWCVERVEAFLGRRSAADALLVAGEVSTLVVSLLRGMDEHAEHGDDGASGSWWLTEAGRPMFVIGEGEDVKAASARIIDRLRRDCGDRALGRVLAAVHDALVEGRVRPRPSTAQLARWEAELFEIAAPRALVLQVQTPSCVRDNAVAQRARQSISEETMRRRERRHRDRARGDADGRVARGRTIGQRLTEFVRDIAVPISGMAARVARVVAPSRRPGGSDGVAPDAGVRNGGARTDSARLDSARIDSARIDREPSVRRKDGQGSRSVLTPSRRRAFVVAGGAAAAVLAGGLLWPGWATGQSDAGGVSSDPESVASAAGTPSSGTPSSDTSEPGEGSDGSSADAAAAQEDAASAEADDGHDESRESQGAASDDPVVAAGALLETIRACGASDDAVCVQAVASGSAGVVESLTPLLDEDSELTVVLIDVYGDIAVVRVSGALDTADADPEAHVGAETETATGETAGTEERMLVLIRQNDNWLVRDAYDVADQPG